MTHESRIYLDNAATSWPKPTSVYDVVDKYQREIGAPVGRSGYQEAAIVERLVLKARSDVGKLLGVSEHRRIIFTLNGTDSLNLALHGLLRPGDHVVTTDAEHNSVLRPLRFLAGHHGIEVTCVGCEPNGMVDPLSIRQALRPATKLVTLTHASNVTGVIQPVAEVGELLRNHGCYYLVDAAQTAGHLPIDCRGWHIDLLASSGHKGLLGPLGTGLLYVDPRVEASLRSVRQGGTGTQSEDEDQPGTLPEKFESGNHNAPGILGLGEGARYVAARGLAAVREHEVTLLSALREGLSKSSHVVTYAPEKVSQQVGVLSFNITGYDPQEVASLLDTAYGIQVRAGLHCAPRMHRALRTADVGGTVRISVGMFNTPEQIAAAVAAVQEIAAA